MSFHSWLQSLRSALTPSRSQGRQRQRHSRRAATYRPNLETLEDRVVPAFLAPVNYAAGAYPLAVVTADFNGDGRLDLATANQDCTVSVLRGNGDGTLQTAQNSASGSDNAVSLAVGDFNGDGKLDLVSGDDNAVSVLLGNGDGTFQAPVSIALGSSPQSVAVGDFNGDGKMDIAATSNMYGFQGDDYYGNPTYGYEGYANVLLGHGDGSFTGPTVTDLGADYDTACVVADFNGDGRSDFATINGGYGTIKVALSDPSGYLVRAGDIKASYPNVITAGDVDGDGHIDLVTANWYGDGVGVLRGNGDGSFKPVQYNAAGGNAISIVLGDFTGDGRIDIAEADYNGDVSLLRGSGAGAFSSPTNIAPGSNPYALAAGDFNGDGFLDLTVADPGSDSVFIMINTGDWPLFQVSGFPSPTTAGQAHTLTVTAPSQSYTGTVHFTSTDGQASLPADYTFTAADHGTHTFSVTLKTAGTQRISVADAGAGATGDEAGIAVNPAAASKIDVSFASSLTAGYSYNHLGVVLRDAYGNLATGYRGTVHFTSSDTKAVLPANYTFTAADAGAHTYFSATLTTAGTQSITATDIATGSLTGTRDGITIYAAQASRIILVAPSSVTAGAPFSLTVTVTDYYGNVVTGYTGTIRFSSTDSGATLPASYTMTAADKGVHTFTGLVLKKNGKQTITIDPFMELSASAIVNVLAPKKN